MTSTAPALVESRRRAMGSEAHVILVGADARLLDVARARIDDLEHRWSRFLPASEVSDLNRNAGNAVVLSADSIELVERCVLAAELTGGRFDPTIGAALVALGYDRDFADVAGTIATVGPAPSPTPGVAGIQIDSDNGTVTLPPGVTFDAGGLGKGLAADLTARTLLESGAQGALVNLGGDIRVAGMPPTVDGWTITVPDPLVPDRELLRLTLTEGAVATSSRLTRRWHADAGDVHHLVDPATGLPVASRVVAVTVVTGEAWWAEALTKMLFLTGPDGLGDVGDAHAVVVTDNGDRYITPSLLGSLR